MPAPVHAVLVARSSTAAAARLERALEAIRAQSQPVASLAIVVRGDPEPLKAAAAAAHASRVIAASERTSFAGAVEMALGDVPEGHVWLLDDDSVPEPGTLAKLASALERQPSVAIAAPKVVRAGDRRRIESFGVTMTTTGRTIELAHGEYDQGQHDRDDDVLGADIRGMLLRADVAMALVPDRAMLGADEGLDMGVRARLGGRRVSLVPDARIAVWPPRQTALRRDYTRRVAQLHRRLAYASPLTLVPKWLGLLPLAVWATVLALLAKRPGRVAPEWMASVTALVRFGSIARSRRRLRQFRTGSWSQVDALRLGSVQLRERQQASEDPRRDNPDRLEFFSGGGAWAVLGGLIVSVAAFVALLTWPAMAGGALLPLRQSVAGLWRDALWGVRPEGLAEVGPADPFGAVAALLGTLWPGGPSYALVLLWLLATPLSILGAWFAATRFTARPVARIALAVLWGAAPPLWDALAQGRSAAVLVHVLLPWLLFAGVAAHRSWTTSGAASILLAGVLACAPSLAPAIGLVWLIGLIVAISARRRRIMHVVWVVIPTIVMFAPLAARQFSRGTPWALFADPDAAAFAHGSAAAVAAGVINPDAWAGLFSDMGLGWTAVWWAPLLLAPIAVLALFAPATRKTAFAVVAIVLAAAGSATAVVDLGARLAVSEGVRVAVWPGSALSLAWLGATVACAIAIDGVRRGRRPLVAVLIVCAALAIVPQATALHRGDTPLHSGSDSTLPAYVSAQARADGEVGTLILTPLADGSVAAKVVWGTSETLGGSSTLERTAVDVSDDDVAISRLAGAIVSGTSSTVVDEVREAGLTFVLLREQDAPGTEQRVMALTAQASMDQRAGFARVGETPHGVLWSVEDSPSPRSGMNAGETTTAWFAGLAQGIILLVALLLAIPTRRTRDQARQKPRLIGPQTEPREERTR